MVLLGTFAASFQYPSFETQLWLLGVLAPAMASASALLYLKQKSLQDEDEVTSPASAISLGGIRTLVVCSVCTIVTLAITMTAGYAYQIGEFTEAVRRTLRELSTTNAWFFVFMQIAAQVTAVFVASGSLYLMRPRHPDAAYGVRRWIDKSFLLAPAQLIEANEHALALTNGSQTAVSFAKAADALPTARAALHFDLRRRARGLQALNRLLLSSIVLVLIGAAIFIVYAGEIAGKDTQSLLVLDRLAAFKSATEEELSRLNRERTGVALAQARVKLRPPLPPEKFGARTDDPAVTTIENEMRMAELTKRISHKEAELEMASKALASVHNDVLIYRLKEPDRQTSSNLMIAAGITRFGVLALVIYLVQILINMYRYNVRVAAFYLAQADSCLVSGDSQKDLVHLAEKLRPDFDFGKSPTAVPTKIADQLRVLVSKIGPVAKERVTPGAGS